MENEVKTRILQEIISSVSLLGRDVKVKVHYNVDEYDKYGCIDDKDLGIDFVRYKRCNMWRKVELYICLLIRMFVGLWRAILIDVNQEESSMLLVRSSVYREFGGTHGDPNIICIKEYLDGEGYKTYELTYPHQFGLSYNDAISFIKDSYSLSFEGICLLIYLSKIASYTNELLNLVTDNEGVSHIKFNYGKRVANWVLNEIGSRYVFVVGEYSTLRKILISSLGDNSVTTIGVQHGVLYRSHPGYTFPPGVFSDMKPDYFLVHGKAYESILNKIGYSRDTEVLCMGHPSEPIQYNNTPNYYDNGLKRVVITSQPASRRGIYLALTSDVSNHVREYLESSVECILKPHPNSHGAKDFFSGVGSDGYFKDFRVISSRSNTIDIISRSDLHVSHTSTCIQESVSVVTPTIELRIPPQYYSFTNNFKGEIPDGLIITSSVDDLLYKVYQLLNSAWEPSRTDQANVADLFAAPLNIDGVISSIVD